MADISDTSLQNCYVCRRWLAVSSTLIVLTGCAPPDSPRALTPASDAPKTARSLELIAEIAAVKITPTTEEPKSSDILLDAQSTTRKVKSLGQRFISQKESPVDRKSADDVHITAHMILVDVELQTAEVAASTPEVSAAGALPATAENLPTKELIASPVFKQPIQPTAINTDTLNGIQLDEGINISPEMRIRMRENCVSGQTRARFPNNFSKFGDSLIATPYFFTQFDKENYVLGDYAYLQRTTDHYAGSFERCGVSIKAELHSRGVWPDVGQ